MQTSLTISNFPSLFPFPQTLTPLPKPYPTLSLSLNPFPLRALKGGTGFLSAIGKAIEEEEYRKARAEVNRKGTELEDYSIEGLSIGGHETCVIVPELKSAFDIGRCPSKAVQQNFLFITHAHLDHIVRFFNVIFCIPYLRFNFRIEFLCYRLSVV